MQPESAPSRDATSLRDELAALDARAMKEGDFDTAAKLLNVARETPARTAGVVDLADERAKRKL